MASSIRASVSVISFLLEFHLKSAANLREHWAVRARRVKAERVAAYVIAQSQGAYRFGLPATVTITRVAPRELDDDNLAAACKGIRDGIADGMGLLGDRHIGLEWRYRQEKGKPSAVRVQIERPAK